VNIGVSTTGRTTAGQGAMRRRRWSGAAALFAVAALAALCAAGTATADTQLQVTINGKPVTSSSPRITAELLYRGTDQWLLTIVNASSNDDGENITAIDGALDQAVAQRGYFINEVAAQEADPGDAVVGSVGNGISLSFTTAPVNVCFQPSAPRTSFSCPTMYAGFGPGSTEEYVLTTNDTDTNLPPLTSIDIQMKIGVCPANGHMRRIASAADADCPLPGTTTITKAKVEKTARRASFSYKAAHAKTYVCELFFRNRVQHRTSCSGAKSYAGLSSGTYFFLVWGVNQAGIARKATVFGFRIG
jgi:hypothetical protein